MKKEIIRAICLISVTAGLYRNEGSEAGFAFLGLMSVIFWALPELICYLTRGGEDHEIE